MTLDPQHDSYIARTKSYKIEVNGRPLGILTRQDDVNKFSLDPEWISENDVLMTALRTCCLTGEVSEEPSQGFVETYASRQALPTNIKNAANDLRNPNFVGGFREQLMNGSPSNTEGVSVSEGLLLERATLRETLVENFLEEKGMLAASEIDEVPGYVTANIENLNVFGHVKEIVTEALKNGSVTMSQCHIEQDVHNGEGQKISVSRAHLNTKGEWKEAKTRELKDERLGKLGKSVERAFCNGGFLKDINNYILSNPELKEIISRRQSISQESEAATQR